MNKTFPPRNLIQGYLEAILCMNKIVSKGENLRHEPGFC